MSEERSAEKDAEFAQGWREALDKIARATRVICVAPVHEAAVREAVLDTPDLGLVKIIVSPACPPNRVLLLPGPPGPLVCSQGQSMDTPLDDL